MNKNIFPKIIVSLIVLCASIGGVLLVLHWVRSMPKIAPLHNATHSPLYEPGDRPTTIYLQEVEAQSGKTINVGVVIHESKIRANQMQQTVLAYLQGPRAGKVQVPVPDGVALNEFYFTPTGAAVVDLDIAQAQKEKVGFTDEALFIRGLIAALTGNFFEVKQVKVLVDGQDAPTIFGHYALGTSEASMPVSASAAGPNH
jgi:hypothetical protein